MRERERERERKRERERIVSCRRRFECGAFIDCGNVARKQECDNANCEKRRTREERKREREGETFHVSQVEENREVQACSRVHGDIRPKGSFS